MNFSTKKKSVACFRRWSRKSYGAFMSVHRHVTIGVLYVGMSIVLLASSLSESYAADTLSTGYKLDSLVIMDKQISPTRSAISKTVLYSRNTEKSAPFQTLESILRVSPYFDVRERGGKGIQTDISIRGGSFDQTMVMLNGVNFTDARTGHQSHSIPLDVEAIGGIELIDGVTGVGAYAGAVNFRTQPLYPKYIKTDISAGDKGYFYSNISGAYSKNNFSIFSAASYRRSDGYKKNTDFANINAYARINYESKAGYFDVQAGYQNRDFGANGFYSLKFPNQFEHTETFLASVKWMKRITNKLSVNLISSYRRNSDRFELVRDNPQKVPFNYHLTDNLGEELRFDYKSNVGVFSLGADYTYNYIYSTVLGEKLNTPKYSGKIIYDAEKGVDNKIFYTNGKSRNIGNFWAKYGNSFDSGLDIEVSSGISTSPYGNSFMWSVSSGYKLLQTNYSLMKFEAGAYKSMRLPTFTDLYYTATGYIGNPHLSPEKATMYRLGLLYSLNKYSATVSAFYRNGKDIIDWVKQNSESDWESLQITKLNTFGCEILGRYLSENGFIRNLTLSYSHVSTDKKSNGNISKYALDYMRNKLSLYGEIAPINSITFAVTATLFDRNGNYADSAGNMNDYKPYFLLDAKLKWSSKVVDLWIDATNITSTKYFDYGGLEMPKIWAVAGISITIH